MAFSLSCRRRNRKTDEGKLSLLLEKYGITLVVDIGANTGQTRDRLRDLGFSGRIVSFEPLADAHAHLCKRSREDPLWTIGPRIALGAQAGEAVINVAESSDMSSLAKPAEALLATLPKAKVVGQERVPVESLDALWSASTWDRERVLVKIDAQGSEADILRGARTSLAKAVAVLVEMSLEPIYAGESDYLAICGTLHGQSYRPVLFLPGYFSRQLERLLQMDGLFVRHP